ncbi:GntR family transcriptional regulator [Spirillospora sp. NPDC048819]|uniref:GntR family transcriptional regulator n=1 Tax=Spirillospora sp. NPDC048819 TaxID=3155268 RepID=UPI00340D0525
MSAEIGQPLRADGRRLVTDIHAHVRELILDGTLPPGAIVPQAELARKLGVSRTPLREAFRMLQEEGLLETAPNQRARVSQIDIAYVDQVYAARILLESLGVALTLPDLTAERLSEMRALLERMKALAEADDWKSWQQAHHEFHAMHSVRIGGQVRQTMSSLAEHCQRYITQNRVHESQTLDLANREHLKLLEALENGDRTAAVEEIVRHLARTVLTTMAHSAPEYEPVSVRTALRMVLGASHV